MEQIYITGPMARSLRRMARRGIGIELIPADETSVSLRSRGRTTLKSLGLDDLRAALGMSASQPVDLRVPDSGSRLRAQGIRSHICSTQLPPKSFELVLPAKECPIDLPHHCRILVDSPQLAFATAAQQLQRAQKTGDLGPLEASLMLLKLGLEDCSTYSLDPWQPRVNDCVYGCKPCLTANDLREYLARLRHFDGNRLSREVAGWVFDKSASPMESLVNVAFSLPIKMGSLCLGDPVANKTIVLSQAERLRLNHVDHITPDLLWEALKIVLEYLGSDAHAGHLAQREDAERVQDFQALGYIVFPVLFEHVRNPREFNKLAIRIASAMESRGARGAKSWVEELISDEEFLARQRKLFEILLPAVANR